MKTIRVVITYSLNGKEFQTTDYAEVTDEKLQALRQPDGCAIIDFLDPFYYAMAEDEDTIWRLTEVHVVSGENSELLVRFR